jgi:CHRD domain
MNKLKLTGLFSLFFATILLLVSCEQDNDEGARYYYLNRTLTGSQVVTPTGAANSGTLTGTYDKETRTLTYKIDLIKFAGRAAANGAPTAIHIHAFADSGFNAIPSAQFANTIAQSFTSGWVLTDSTEILPSTNPKTYTYGYVFNGTLFVDNYLIREEDLLAGKFYVDVHTSQPNFPPTGARGTIRGQLIFTKQKP